MEWFGIIVNSTLNTQLEVNLYSESWWYIQQYIGSHLGLYDAKVGWVINFKY